MVLPNSTPLLMNFMLNRPVTMASSTATVQLSSNVLEITLELKDSARQMERKVPLDTATICEHSISYEINLTLGKIPFIYPKVHLKIFLILF